MWLSRLTRLHSCVDRSKALRYAALLATLVVGLLWFFLLRPGSLGGPASYVIVSGVSMQPTYQSGDLVVMRRSSSYAAGDIIAYRVPKGEQGEGSLIIHRIVARDEKGYITKGDNRAANDLWRPSVDDIAGQAWLHLPGAGTIVARLKAPLPLATIAATFAVYLVLSTGSKQSKKEQPSASDSPC